MPGITNPAEEYFKDGLWGWAATVWEKLVSSGGRLFTAPHGWDGDSWQKLPMVWGYSDRWSEPKSSTTGAAGTRILDFTAVGDGEVWVLLALDAWNSITDPAFVQFQVVAGAVTLRLNRVLTPGIGKPVMWQGHIVLKKDDYVQARFDTCVLDDNVFANVVGYKMKIAE